MAEFQVIFRESQRMCSTYSDCTDGCPLYDDEDRRCMYRALSTSGTETAAEIERIVIAWAAENLAPRYPTWNEWQEKMFPDASEKMEPCSFASVDKLGCAGLICKECREQPIPADIAEKLGIKPVGGGESDETHKR